MVFAKLHYEIIYDDHKFTTSYMCNSTTNKKSDESYMAGLTSNHHGQYFSNFFAPFTTSDIYIPPSLNILQNCKTCIHVHNGYWVKAKLNIHICYMLYHICFIFGRQYIAFYSVVILDLGLRSMWWMLTFLMKSKIGPFFRVQNF